MLTLSLIPNILAIVRLDPHSDIPAWVLNNRFFSVTRTEDELSVVCYEDIIPSDLKVEGGWRGLKVEGPLDFGLTGILSSLALPLAEAKISIFALSTYDTDYILVKKENIERATAILGKFCNIKRNS